MLPQGSVKVLGLSLCVNMPRNMSAGAEPFDVTERLAYTVTDFHHCRGL